MSPDEAAHCHRREWFVSDEAYYACRDRTAEAIRRCINDPCSYCRRTDCHRCVSKIQMDMMQVIDMLEKAIIWPDETDGVGINMHLRNVWSARDAINTLLSMDEGEDDSPATAQGRELARRIREGLPIDA